MWTLNERAGIVVLADFSGKRTASLTVRRDVCEAGEAERENRKAPIKEYRMVERTVTA
jgi:hypothetical protein